MRHAFINKTLADVSDPGMWYWTKDLIVDPAGQQQWADRLARVFGEIEAAMRAQGLLPR